jgi:uncharacterized protein YbbK (DUF523 family)/uncharacterized protein YbgA (DUF1722 family)
VSVKPRLGISSCLLGRKVRFDGRHAADPYLRATLGRHVEWVPICPEVECGFPVPREPMRLKGDPSAPRLMTVSTGKDHTERMRRWTESRLRELAEAGLCGFVFKSGSPSCGPRGVRVSSFKAAPPRKGAGVFARAFSRRFTLLPCVDEEGLRNPKVRERFIERVYVVTRWRDFLEAGATLSGLLDFHAQHELLFAAHSPDCAKSMERLLSRPGAMRRVRLIERYTELLARALEAETTTGKNVKVLKGISRRLELSQRDAAHVASVIDDYRAGHVPLLVPIVLLRHYVERFEDIRLSRQRYLDPYPAELGLRAQG